jgi:hypothetical protein
LVWIIYASYLSPTASRKYSVGCGVPPLIHFIGLLHSIKNLRVQSRMTQDRVQFSANERGRKRAMVIGYGYKCSTRLLEDQQNFNFPLHLRSLRFAHVSWTSHGLGILAPSRAYG